MPKLLRLLLSIFAVLSLGVALAACGDDDDADTDDTTTTEAADEATDEGEDGGEEASGPLCAEGDAFIFPPSSEPAEGAEAVSITATEEEAGGQTVYSFSDNAATDLGEVGSYAVTFQNEGEEMHELIVTRLNDDETRSVPELLAAVGEGTDPASFSTDVGTTSACPGEETVVGAEIEDAGRYLLVCAFPVGATPGLTEDELPEGPPHAAQGMVVEMVVS
ncbi:MAG TPA: hypothetical protein VJ804_00180 [Acidimicrobiales bacterium]|nr:hypothetical protein [Acidimicrobiales bacterium]